MWWERASNFTYKFIVNVTEVLCGISGMRVARQYITVDGMVEND